MGLRSQGTPPSCVSMMVAVAVGVESQGNPPSFVSMVVAVAVGVGRNSAFIHVGAFIANAIILSPV